jgi:hypothetical protein
MSKSPQGLSAFLDSQSQKKSGPSCWLCSIPEREEVDAERRSRGEACRISLVREYLVGIYGDMATRHRVGNHFRERHHERPNDR